MFQQPSAAPFFTNDWAGAFKLVGIFGSMLAVTIGVIVKWGQSSFKDRLDSAIRDLDELGKKIDRVDRSCLEQASRMNDMRERVARTELQIGVLQKEHGQNEAITSSLEKQINTLQGAILIAMSDQFDERDERITKLEVATGRLDERLHLRALLRSGDPG